MIADNFTTAAAPPTTLLPFPPNRERRVLVVEEEDKIRNLNVKTLVDADYQVDAAENGVVAWGSLQFHDYDLLIIDQFLPKVSGVELLKRVYNARMKFPVIMTTEIVPTWEFALHPCLQSVAMLQKPFTAAKLLGLVKKVLESATRCPVKSALIYN